MARMVSVAKATEIPVGTATCVEVHGKRIALFHTDDGFYAIDDECTHEGGSLADGEFDADEVECPLHMATFNLRTGEATGPPAEEDVRAYPVHVEGDDVQIEID